MAMIENELLGRYGEVNEGNITSPTFYFGILLSGWNNALLICLIMSFVVFFQRSLHKNSFLYFLCISSVFILIITASATRLKWYVLPVYPLIGLLLGITFQTVFDYFRFEQFKRKTLFKIGLLIILFGFAICKTVQSRIFPSDVYKPEIYEAANALKNHKEPLGESGGTFVDFGDYSPQTLFYSYIAGFSYKNYNSISLMNHPRLVVTDSLIKVSLEKNFDLSSERTEGDLSFFSLDSIGIIDPRVKGYDKEMAMLDGCYYLYSSSKASEGVLLYKGYQKPERLSFEFNCMRSDGSKYYNTFEVEKWHILPNKNRVKYIQLRDIPLSISLRKLDTKDTWFMIFPISY